MDIHFPCCPNCGANIDYQGESCEYCGSKFVITNFRSPSAVEWMKYSNQINGSLKDDDSADVHYSKGYAFLMSGLYDKALAEFDRSIECNLTHGDGCFLASVAVLKGKKAFVCDKVVVDKAIEYAEAAFSIEMNPVYKAMVGYLKYDFYARKFLRTSPDYKEEMAISRELGLTRGDIDTLFGLVKTDVPSDPAFSI